MKKNSLNDLYMKYSQGLLKKKEFEGLLFKAILDNLQYFNLYQWKKDDCMDYLSWLYPRLSRAVDTYKNNGATFESYVGTLIRWSAREYRSRRENQITAEQMVWMAKFSDTHVNEEEPDYFLPNGDTGSQGKEIKPVKNPRQVLMLILKCYHYCSDDFLNRLAPSIGIEKNKLKQMVDSLRRQRIRHDETHRLMRERIHSQYYRCVVYEKRLGALSENSVMYSKTKIQLQKARQRLDAMRKRLAKLRMEATNLQIAKILGIKKGTVDSNLHALRTRLQSASDVLPSEKTTAPDPL
jgi:RNA polymerase sigma factor (sigma-70 family)